MKLPEPLENLIARLGLRSGSKPASGIPSKQPSEAEQAMEDAITVRCYEKLLAETSSPLSQLILQLHLCGKNDSVLTAADVLIHVKRLITVFEQNGMRVLGSAGEVLPFNPEVHELITVESRPQPGTSVRVRFPGIAYRKSIIRKATVDHLEAQ